MSACIFCKIAKGQVDHHKIYEDKATVAFLDRNPIRPGHLLVIPKQHKKAVWDLGKSEFSALMATVHKMADRITVSLKPKKVGMLVAGWDVPHAHVHVIPMRDYHDITSKCILLGERKPPTEEQFNTIAKKLKRH